MTEDRTLPCPPPESIRHYAAGGFDDEQAEQLEEHLLSCPHCETLLDGLDDPSDAIIQALSTLPVSSDDEAAYQQLRRTALASTTEFVGTDDAAAKLRLAHRLADPDLGPLPFKLGNYELLACIGRGASGAVYRARHLKLEQIAAVKVLDASRSIDPHSFQQEMKTIGSLTHPNIVRATDAGEAEGHHFLVMEYIEGIDASRVLFRNGPLKVADACEIVRQAALGLQFVHEQSLIHRDVKPSNLLVTVDGQVKLLDLGIARRLDDPQPNDNGHLRPQGTYDYMAPEAWKNPTDIDSRSDLYSLGCTLYRLLTAEAAPKESQLNTNLLSPVPRSVQRLLQKLLAGDPQQRPSSTQEVLDTLEPACRTADLPNLIAKVAPQLATLVTSKATSQAHLRNRWNNRRKVLAGLVSVGTIAFLVPKMRYLFYPTLERIVWRPLAPVSPKFLLVTGDPQEVVVGTKQPAAFELSVDDLTLLNLGRPVNGVFSMAVEFAPPEPTNCGVFFRAKFDYAKSIRTLEFQSIQLVQLAKQQSALPEYRLVWSHWKSEGENGAVDSQPTPLAEVNVTLASNSSHQTLQVTCGRQGMPEVSWNGMPLHESMWSLSAEGHALQRMSTKLLPTAYLGRIGVFSTRGTTTFRSPKLAYL